MSDTPTTQTRKPKHRGGRRRYGSRVPSQSPSSSQSPAPRQRKSGGLPLNPAQLVDGLPLNPNQLVDGLPLNPNQLVDPLNKIGNGLSNGLPLHDQLPGIDEFDSAIAHKNKARDAAEERALALRLDVNLDVVVSLRATVHGDLTVSLL
ncbi:hypothetical protein Moror_1830 [Moniliophthora roreri MCA 2997]|uniref:Uncharacterized protein n=2 Tax=Moniliophthora roreri TaxID=221103 RepID=V2Y7T4_MONRO|nr:hypothetical protein Moror_1830 [Moniliophthora roreri MCA 2997]